VIEPHIGDIVHHVSFGTPHGEYPASCMAAIVSATYPHEPGTDDSIVDLHVFKPWGQDIRSQVLHDDGEEDPNAFLMCRGRDYPPGTWHWPA
jgi:hypothetical protein